MEKNQDSHFSTTKMLSIIFDSDVLKNFSDSNGSRAGIYFCAFELLKQFYKNPEIKLYLYVDTKVFIEKHLDVFVREYVPNVQILNEHLSFKEWAKRTLKKRDALFSKKGVFAVLHRKFLSWLVRNAIRFCGYMPLDRKFSDLCRNSSAVYFTVTGPAPKVFKKRKFKAIKKFFVLHDAIPKILSGEENYNRKKDWWDYVFDELNSRDFYFANSNCTRNDFLRFAPAIRPDHIFTIPLAAAERFGGGMGKNIPLAASGSCAMEKIFDKYHIPHGNGEKYIFSLCSLIPRKNLVRAIRCFNLFIEKNHIENMYFVLGGGALEKDFFAEMTASSSMKNRVIVTGYMDDDDSPFLYKNAQWFVYTSRYEGFGIPPLEAMMSGCPVVVSNSSSLPEVVGDAGIQVSWDSDDEHVAAFEKMYYDEDFRKKCAEKGLERARLFSWEKTAKKMVEKMMENI